MAFKDAPSDSLRRSVKVRTRFVGRIGSGVQVRASFHESLGRKVIGCVLVSSKRGHF